MSTNNYFSDIKKRIGWYPVSTLGWAVAVIYLALLTYVVFQINTDLYSTNKHLFYGSMLMVGIIVLIMLWARYTNERPFEKK